MEVFILPGYNDDPRELDAIGEALRRIKPALVDLNTLDRPGTVGNLIKPSNGELAAIIERWHDLPVRIISKVGVKAIAPLNDRNYHNRILETVRRRPSTLDDLVQGLGLDRARLEELCAKLVADGSMKETTGERGTFYQIV
jgi:wyosine [tRNA(Phe)-imidazoG37] synthetase (radical SAM superfamily)